MTAVGSGEEALEALELERFDCMVLDLKLPEMGGFALLEKLKEDERYSSIPVIVYTGKELTRRRGDEAEEVRRVDRRQGRELARAAARRDVALPPPRRAEAPQGEAPDAGAAAFRRRGASSSKKILIVDDDVRNVFALTSVLESHGMEVMYAENGKDGIEPPAASSRDRPRPDGHHDAGDGRLRDDAGHPPRGGASNSCRSSPSPRRR